MNSEEDLSRFNEIVEGELEPSLPLVSRDALASIQSKLEAHPEFIDNELQKLAKTQPALVAIISNYVDLTKRDPSEEQCMLETFVLTYVMLESQGEIDAQHAEQRQKNLSVNPEEESSNTEESNETSTSLPLVSKNAIHSLHGDLVDQPDLIRNKFFSIATEQTLLTEQIMTFSDEVAHDTQEAQNMLETLILTYVTIEYQAKTNAINSRFDMNE